MSEPPIDNQSDFIAHPQLIVHKDGEKLVVMVKATWELESGELVLAPEERQRGLRPVDLPWGLPGETTTMYPRDFCVSKVGTDVVVIARAFAPGSEAAEAFDVGLRIGAINKLLRVFGLRVWQTDGSGLSSARPIQQLDLRYEYAWGGMQMSDDGTAIVEEARNTMGRGIALDSSSLTHQQAPQIEDPFDLISSIHSKPVPAGFGAIMSHWQPRRGFAGTYDEAWLDGRSPLPPLDEDERTNNVAHPDLIHSPALRGGEEVALSGLTPGGGGHTFLLPKIALEIEIRAKDREPEIFHPELDTVVIDMLEGTDVGVPTVEMVWRAAVVATRRMKDGSIIIREITPC